MLKELGLFGSGQNELKIWNPWNNLQFSWVNKILTLEKITRQQKHVENTWNNIELKEDLGMNLETFSSQTVRWNRPVTSLAWASCHTSLWKEVDLTIWKLLSILKCDNLQPTHLPQSKNNPWEEINQWTLRQCGGRGGLGEGAQEQAGRG